MNYDITLDGHGYMLAPGTYRRGLDAAGGVGGPPVRQVQREWAGGAGRAVQGERDRFWQSRALLPVGRGDGPGPGPRETTFTVAGLAPLKRRHGVSAGGRPYLATGGGLWRPERGGAGTHPNNLAGVGQLGATLLQEFTGLATDGADRLFLSRAGAGYAVWPIGGGAFDLAATVQLVGCAWYAGSLWGGVLDPAGWRLARVVGPGTIEGTGWPLDSAPRAFATVRDGLYLGTGGGLWRVRGAVVGGVFSGEIAPLASGGGGADDFCALAEFGGDLYTWAGGEVVRYHVTAGGGATLLPAGRRGWACRGLAVAGGWLFAALVDGPDSADVALWAYDGAGWWCVARNLDGEHDYSWPTPTASYFDNADLLAWGLGLARCHAFQLRPRAGQPGLAPDGELTTALWHGRDPDAAKGWTRIGAELAWPGGAAFAPCTATLAYATDGATFTPLASAALLDATSRSLVADLPPGTIGKWLALRYTIGGVADGAPTLAALWAEYRPVETPRRRRHWAFTVLAADKLLDRAGRPDPRGGTQIAADLRAAWEGGGTLPFRDLDDPLEPRERAVRIVALDEAIAAPADAGRWTESRIAVRLVEV